MERLKEFQRVQFDEKYARQYWEGPQNLFIRIYAYFREGVGLINEGKYILAFLGLGVFKSDILFQWWMLTAGVIIGVPVLILVGRWDLYRANKARQFITTVHGSVTQWQGHNMAVEQTRMMAEILEELKKLNGNKQQCLCDTDMDAFCQLHPHSHAK